MPNSPSNTSARVPLAQNPWFYIGLAFLCPILMWLLSSLDYDAGSETNAAVGITGLLLWITSGILLFVAYRKAKVLDSTSVRILSLLLFYAWLLFTLWVIWSMITFR
jgi:hypothetical protein